MDLKINFKYNIKKLPEKIINYFLRFLFKVFIYSSIFMTLELSGRFMKFGDPNGFVPVPILMIFVYMHIAWLDDLLIPFFNKIKLPKWSQAIFIMLLIYTFEFGFGLFFKYALKITVWDYSHVTFFGQKANFLGIISIYSLLAWYGVAWFIIWIYPRIKCMVDYPNFNKK